MIGRAGDHGRFQVSADLVLGAGGRHCVVARRLGLGPDPSFPRRLALSCHMDGIQDLGEMGEMHVFDGGYCGVAPIGDERANVTAVVPLARMKEVRAVGPEAFLRGLLEGHGPTSGRFRGASLPRGVRLMAPLAVGVRRRAAGGILLAGDAGGFLDPFTGEGIHRALLTGRLAAEFSLEALDGLGTSPELLRRYEREFRRMFRGRDRTVRLLAALVDRPALGRLVLALLRRRPRVAEGIVRRAGDCPLPEEVHSVRDTIRYLLRGRSRIAEA